MDVQDWLELLENCDSAILLVSCGGKVESRLVGNYKEEIIDCVFGYDSVWPDGSRDSR